MSGRASNSSYRKRPDTLPDLEDFGKMLGTYGLDRGEISDQSQSPNQKDCRTCDRKDTCETAVHASSQRIKKGISVSGEEAQYTKDQEVIKSSKGSESKVPKAHKRVTKQDFKTASLDAARQAK